MPTLSKFYGIVVFMNYNDHNPPHFHPRYSGSYASEVHQSRGDTAVRPPICTAPDR